MKTFLKVLPIIVLISVPLAVQAQWTPAGTAPAASPPVTQNPAATPEQPGQQQPQGGNMPMMYPGQQQGQMMQGGGVPMMHPGQGQMMQGGSMPMMQPGQGQMMMQGSGMMAACDKNTVNELAKIREMVAALQQQVSDLQKALDKK